MALPCGLLGVARMTPPRARHDQPPDINHFTDLHGRNGRGSTAGCVAVSFVFVAGRNWPGLRLRLFFRGALMSGLSQAQHNDLRRLTRTHKAGGLSSCHPRHKGQDDATSPSSCPLPYGREPKEAARESEGDP